MSEEANDTGDDLQLENAQSSDQQAAPLNDQSLLPKPVENLGRKLQETLALNDVDENGAPIEKRSDLERRLRREEKANKTRKIKVMEVKAETQTGVYIVQRLTHRH